MEVLRRDLETITLSCRTNSVKILALDSLLHENGSKSKDAIFFKHNPLAGHASCDVYCGARRDGW